MVGLTDTNDGKILKNTGDLYNEIATNYPSNNYTQLCNQFDVRFAQSEGILKRHLLDYKKAVKEVLNTWEDKGNATRAKLESALKKAETGALCTIVKEHFANGEASTDSGQAGRSQTGILSDESDEEAEEEDEFDEDESDEEQDESEEEEDESDEEQPRTLTQTGGTNTINASGASNVSGNNVIGQQTNNYNSAPSVPAVHHHHITTNVNRASSAPARLVYNPRPAAPKRQANTIPGPATKRQKLTASRKSTSKGTTAKPKGTTSKPKKTTSKPKGTNSKPKGTTSKPKGTNSKPKGTTSKPKGTTSNPKGTTSKPKGTPSKPKGTTSKPKGTTSKPKKTKAPKKKAPKTAKKPKVTQKKPPKAKQPKTRKSKTSRQARPKKKPKR
eukprot:XP_011662976.1 PREDICTED: salivary glue protein Sgs-3-like [Strongylocentrotus purpuratus]